MVTAAIVSSRWQYRGHPPVVGVEKHLRAKDPEVKTVKHTISLYQPDSSIAYSKESLLRNPKRTYSAYCRSRFHYNNTWGKTKAHLVDKYGVKSILAAMNLKPLELVPTQHYLTRDNISDFTFETLQSIPKPFVMKPTHTSGGIALITKDGEYTCFKRCQEKRSPGHELPSHFHVNQSTFSIVRKRLELQIEAGFGFTAEKKEPQYAYVPHGIIFERQLPLDVMTEFSLWVVYGHVAFAQLICNDET